MAQEKEMSLKCTTVITGWTNLALSHGEEVGSGRVEGEHCLVVKENKDSHPEWFLFARPQFSSVLPFLIELNNQTHHW